MPQNLPMVKFSAFAPDISSLGTGVSAGLFNVVPRIDGYGPVKSLTSFTAALPGPCRGYFFSRKGDGSIAVFAATATNLYVLNNSDFTWTNVSKGGGPYAAVPGTSNWQFAQFNDTVIAVQVNVPPQSISLNAITTFADLAGSPPQAGAIAVVGFFLVLTELLSNPRRVHWCDLGNITTWTAGVGLADFQDLSDGGNAHGIAGGDAYGLLFQDSAIRQLIYAPGSAVVFQINRIVADDGIYAKYSIINIGTRTFFSSPQGFKMINAGQQPVPIGKGFVDDFFKGDVDDGQLQLAIGSSDPTQTRVYFGYKSKQGTAGLIDRILVYDWSIGQGGRWSIILSQSIEYLASLAKPGLTLESLDLIAPFALTITGAAASPGGGPFGAGKVRLTLSPGLSNGPFDITTQNFFRVYGVLGTTEANGTYYRVSGGTLWGGVDATHIDLNVNFVNAYTGGGRIGGSLDDLGFSLDSISVGAQAQLSAMSSNHSVGFFDGPNLEAIIETEEQDAQGQLIFISGMMPITDCPTVMASVGSRMTAQTAAATYSTESLVNDDGFCPQLVETRYARGRLRFPAGAVWTYARGVQPEVQPAGDS